MKPVIVIPAYNHSEQLSELTAQLRAGGFEDIVVIDDGSDAACQPVFDELGQAGCLVCHHTVNRGKGSAIKTAVHQIVGHFPQANGFITMDADGQHAVADVVRVAEAMETHPDSLVLGTRDFHASGVPLRSRLGNAFSARYFKRATGVACTDTQTGLRGIPRCLLREALQTDGDRYDYEMNFLTAVAKSGMPFYEVPIRVIYANQNRASHFRVIADSVRIYRRPLRFTLSSLFCSLVDLGIFTLISSLINADVYMIVLAATVVARLCSGALNFILNLRWSFDRHGGWKRPAVKYGMLYIAQMLLSWGLVTLLSFLPLNLTLVKMMVDCALFACSYFVQRHWVFRRERDAAGRAAKGHHI